MAAATEPRKSISIRDYPEHLNPFHEDDNHNKIRFWTIGKKLNRSNSINFSGIKELKNSWAFRSFMRKGKKKEQTSKVGDSNNKVANNGDSSPLVFRRALNYSSVGSRSTVGSPERYLYGGSVTPLPRSRFQERLRSPSQHEVNSLSVTPRMARSEVSGSRLSVESTNPFDEPPIPPIRASRRKKKRAPAPPGLADTSICSTNSELQISECDEKIVTINTKTEPNHDDLHIDETNLNIELKIVEEKDVTEIQTNDIENKEANVINPTDEVKNQSNEKLMISKDEVGGSTEAITKRDELENDVDESLFPRVDIVRYRRNSSLDEDALRLRRGNLEEIHAMSNKRSKSMNNSLNAGFVTFDINLNESKTDVDTNGNEEPHKVVCKLYDNPRKLSIDNSISSTEKEFIEIDKATRELEKEISKLNTALLEEDDVVVGHRVSVSEIKRKFDRSDISSPNPIPKPRRTNYGDSSSPVNGNVHI